MKPEDVGPHTHTCGLFTHDKGEVAACVLWDKCTKDGGWGMCLKKKPKPVKSL